MTRQRTILLISADEVGWADLRAALSAIDSARIIGEATSADQVGEFAAIAGRAPDVVISAARVAGASALPLLTAVRRTLWPESLGIVVASHFDAAEFMALAGLGIAGYLLWGGLAPRAMRQCLAAMLARDLGVVDGAVVLAFVAAHHGAPSGAALTAREQLVLTRLADGASRKEIALEEGLSPRTVRRVVADLERKLGASSPFTLALQAMRRGLLR